MASRSNKKPPSFEEGLNQLEKMAQEMENSNLPLEEMIRLYEDGVKLAGELSQKLEGMKATLQTVKPAPEQETDNFVMEGQLSMTEWMEETQE